MHDEAIRALVAERDALKIKLAAANAQLALCAERFAEISKRLGVIAEGLEKLKTM